MILPPFSGLTTPEVQSSILSNCTSELTPHNFFLRLTSDGTLVVKGQHQSSCNVFQIAVAALEVMPVINADTRITTTKTNIRQTLVSLVGANNLFGTALKPFNRQLIANNSISGESALVTMRDTIVEFRTNVKSSISFPIMCALGCRASS